MTSRPHGLVIAFALGCLALFAMTLLGCGGNPDPCVAEQIVCRAQGGTWVPGSDCGTCTFPAPEPCGPDNPCPDGEICIDGECETKPEPCSPGSCSRDPEAPKFCAEGECVACPDLGDAIWNTAVPPGEPVCSTPERPVKHWPPTSECPILTEPCDDPPPLPEPQCKLNPDGSPKGCDCFYGEVRIECPTDGCSFPQGLSNDRFTVLDEKLGTMGSVVNAAMAKITGCHVGQEPCPISVPVDVWFGVVCEELRAQGFCCGRHIDTPPGHDVCPPGANCTDQISVKRTDFCDGRPHEQYRVINPRENAVRWYPSATLFAYRVDCGSQPPPGVCTDPDPRGLPAEYALVKHGPVWDRTLKVRDRAYCDAVCSPLEPDVCFTGRNACPVRFEGDPERELCEAVIEGDARWWCDDVLIDKTCDETQGHGPCLPPNPSQAKCHGRVKTCSEDGAACSPEKTW